MVVRPNKASMNLAAKSKTDIDGARFARGFANRVLMSFGDKRRNVQSINNPFE